MKFDKKNLKHWISLLISGLFISIGLIIRLFSGSKKDRVIFYGHKLNGNLKAIYDYALERNQLDIYYASMDPAYVKKLKLESVQVLKLTNLIDVIKISRSSMIINDHGSQLLRAYLIFTKIKFVDVWHGIPYKGWRRDAFGEQKQYNQVWVSSPTMRQKYIKQYNFNPKILKVTGYARVDGLAHDYIDKQKMIEKYQLPKYSHYILLAPTWQQDVSGRSIIPFNAGKKFFEDLNKTAKKHDALIIFRAHLNVGDGLRLDRYSNIAQMSHKDYPLSEEFLAVADILITDWSSIAFDYLVLKRPTIFLDVPAPFAEGFTFGPEYRFGPVVKNMNELTSNISKYLGKNQAFRRDFKRVIGDTIEVAYGDTLRESASKQCYQELTKLINEKS